MKNTAALIAAIGISLAVVAVGWKMAQLHVSDDQPTTTQVTVPAACLDAIKASRSIQAYRIADDPTSTDPVVMEMHQQIQVKIADQRAEFKAAAADCRAAAYTN